MLGAFSFRPTSTCDLGWESKVGELFSGSLWIGPTNRDSTWENPYHLRYLYSTLFLPNPLPAVFGTETKRLDCPATGHDWMDWFSPVSVCTQCIPTASYRVPGNRAVRSLNKSTAPSAASMWPNMRIRGRAGCQTPKHHPIGRTSSRPAALRHDNAGRVHGFRWNFFNIWPVCRCPNPELLLMCKRMNNT